MKTDNMKATLTIELRPFTTPNYVMAAKQEDGKLQDGFKEARGYPLSDIAPETLEKLCDQFRAEIFKKAGKQRPPQPAEPRDINITRTCPHCGNLR